MGQHVNIMCVLVHSLTRSTGHVASEMPVGVVALMVVVLCFTVVQLHHGVVHAGAPRTVDARHWAMSRPQLTDQWKHIQQVVPDLRISTKSDRAMINSSKRRRYRYVEHYE